MPILLHRQPNRRDFLKTTTLGGVALILAAGRSAAATDAEGGEFHLALLSDTHIPADRTEAYRGSNPCDNLDRIVPEVLAARPKGVVLCGDAARLEGKLEDYRQLRAQIEPLAAAAPVCIGLGNHDDRANFRKVFTSPAGTLAPIDGKHVIVIEHPSVRVVVLDSLLYPNRVAGLLGKAQRAWLASSLPTLADRPLVFFVHHTLGEGDGDLLDADRLFTIVRPHRHVKAIFYGHSHVWELGERDRLQLINLPALGYNFRDQDPIGWVDARFRSDGVSLTLRAVGGNRTDDGKTFDVRWI